MFHLCKYIHVCRLSKQLPCVFILFLLSAFYTCDIPIYIEVISCDWMTTIKPTGLHIAFNDSWEAEETNLQTGTTNFSPLFSIELDTQYET